MATAALVLLATAALLDDPAESLDPASSAQPVSARDSTVPSGQPAVATPFAVEQPPQRAVLGSESDGATIADGRCHVSISCLCADALPEVSHGTLHVSLVRIAAGQRVGAGTTDVPIVGPQLGRSDTLSVEPGRYEVCLVVGKGPLPVARVELPAGRQDVRLACHEMPALGGVVIDQDGRPIEGVQLRAEPSTDTETLTTSTDELGRFLICPVPVGSSWSVTATSPRYRELRRRDLVPRAQRPRLELELVLKPTAIVRGLVLDPDEKPAPLVTVRLKGPLDNADTTTDDAGRFEFADVQGGRVTLATQGDDQVNAARALQVKVGSEHDVTLQLSEGAWLTGVLRVDTPLPPHTHRGLSAIPASAEGQPTAAALRRRGRPDADSRFRLGPFTPGKVRVRAPQLGIDQLVETDTQVVLYAAPVTPHPVQLELLDGMTGEPVQGFGVLHWHDDPIDEVHTVKVRDGHARVLAVAASHESRGFDLAVDGYATVTVATLDLSDDEIHVVLRLPHAVKHEIRVVDSDGAPVPWPELRVSGEGRGPQRPSLQAERVRPLPGGGIRYAVTLTGDREGRIQLVRPGPGSLAWRVSKTGYYPTSGTIGGPLMGATVVLERVAPELAATTPGG